MNWVNVLNLLFTALVAAPFVWMSWTTVRGYQAATGSTWARLVAAFRGSASVAWARINTFSAVAVSAFVEVSSWLGVAGVDQVAEKWLSPKLMLAYALAVLFGAEIARRRTLKSE